MNICSKRFNIKSDGFGSVGVKDRDAPYHYHTIDLSDMPSINQIALMTESQFDSVISDLIYT